MARLTYQDAVKILGAGNSPVVQALDKLFGGLLLGATPFVPDLLSIFDAKSELTKLADELVTHGIDKRRKLTQFDRIQRLHAARGVLMVTAFFEALEHADLPFRLGDARISRKDAMGLAGSGTEHGSLSEVTSAILDTELPLLGVHADSKRVQAELENCYKTLGDRFRGFVEGLSIWDELDETQRVRTLDVVGRVVPLDAVRRFDVLMQRAATDCPEFAIWLNLAGHQMTRDGLARLGEAVRLLLDRAAPVEQVPPALQAVVRVNRAILDRKLINVDELPDGLDAPKVEQAYIDPHFRLVEADLQNSINSEDFWYHVESRKKFSEFLLGYLATPWALLNPLVILGHPGAGKSLLTQVQAASLPSPDYVTVRVPLRDVPADAEIHEQIEQAVRLATHESVSWPDFARAAGDSVLVVMLDGFDELLQATGVSKSDYLVRVKRFQEIEATQGRHVAVIVTSRVTVADRMRLPGRTAVVRLDPFDLGQVERWLDEWNSVNRDHLVSAGHGPLDLDVIERHLDLASQPLLLLMLAVYDAEGGALRDSAGSLSQTELYERLLRRFARREVSKHDSDAGADEIERELLLLSVIAFGMFNRGAQWITDEQLAEDLTALQLTPPARQNVTAGHRRLAGPAKDALGRFFFVHRAKTSLDEVEIGTYEFLHATFGEYLVVRLAWQCLVDMIDRAGRGDSSFFSGQQRIDDAKLRAFLSWSVLSVRANTMDFLDEYVATLSDEQRGKMRGAVLAAFHDLHQPEANVTYRSYGPAAKTPTQRLATYGANLLLLVVAIGSSVTSDELYPHASRGAEEWRRDAQFWQSQLTSDEWLSLSSRCVISRDVNDRGERLVRLSVRKESSNALTYSNFGWPYAKGSFRDYIVAGTLGSNPFFQSAAFICDVSVDIVAGALVEAGALLEDFLTFVNEGGRGFEFVAADMFAAFSFHGAGASRSKRHEVYARIVSFVRFTRGHFEERFASQVLQMLVNDEVIYSEFIVEQLRDLAGAFAPPVGPGNLSLLLRLFSRVAQYEVVLESLGVLMEQNELRVEQIAETWCVLAEKGIPHAQFPEKLREQASLLRWPERGESLAHRPDLLKRLSVLDDKELL
ncbi:NACHT domain-containing NTPase [Amycolatopsis sp. cg5]|uniref:NACHT domain-containing protein n=1 Tax=Amycolatopsis sp. cg5 TaxID=3238802 RepID=UPI00352662BD